VQATAVPTSSRRYSRWITTGGLIIMFVTAVALGVVLARWFDGR
jgi:hypothetical protein